MAAIVLALASAAQAVSLPSGLDGLGVTIYRQSMQPGDYDMIAAAGLKVARTDLGWGYVETVKGVYDFSAFDAFYSGFHSRGITPLFILDYSNSLYGGNGFNTGLDTQEFRDGYAAYAAAAAAHFKAMGGGVVWELWNEPDNSTYWSPVSATNYMAMVKEAVPAIRQADPSDPILAPSTSTVWGGGTTTFLTTCFQQGLLGLVDAVDVHGYLNGGVGDPEMNVSNYASLRSSITHYTPKGTAILPVTCSEWGYAASADGVGEQAKADDLARVFLVNLSEGIPLTTWYSWESGGNGGLCYGLVPDGTRVPNPAYYAAQLLTSSLRGETFSQKLSDGNSADWLLVFTGGGHTTLAAWTTGTSDTATVTGWGTLHLTSTPFYVDPTLLPGDANLDGTVDVKDLAILAANYRKPVTGGWTQADFNHDGVVDVEDLALLAANYRHSLALDVVPAYDGLDAAAIRVLSVAGVTVVPEPGALVLLATGLIATLAYAWMKRGEAPVR